MREARQAGSSTAMKDMASAAKALGIPRRTLNEKMNRLGIGRRDITQQASG